MRSIISVINCDVIGIPCSFFLNKESHSLFASSKNKIASGRVESPTFGRFYGFSKLKFGEFIQD